MRSASLNPVFYFDTSALVKRYVTETGSLWVMTLCNPSASNTIATARITYAEAAAAFAGKFRRGGLSRGHYQNILRDLAHDIEHQCYLMEIDDVTVKLAVKLTTRQKLRGYDAVQLASALTLNQILIDAHLPPLKFVAADNDLLLAAQNEGLLTDNPNLHP